jgi:hypothetical protein
VVWTISWNCLFYYSIPNNSCNYSHSASSNSVLDGVRYKVRVDSAPNYGNVCRH